MEHINPANLDAYIQALTTSLPDKLFFAHRIPDDVSVFVDFGCADGALLWATMQARFGKPQHGQNIYLGYDHNAQMIRAAECRVSFAPDFDFTDSLNVLKMRLSGLHGEGRKSCLILSSVVHEVLSQGQRFADFWNEVRNLGCDYVVFRDMAVCDQLSRTRIPQRDYASLCAGRSEEDVYKVTSFEQRHGPIRSRADLIHLLLKMPNPLRDWPMELAENYLPLSAEAYLNNTTIGSGYGLDFYEHSTVPALQALWLETFGLKVPEATHLKMILRKVRP